MLQKLSPATRLAIIYFFVSSIWILLSDELVTELAGNNIALLARIQSMKGLAFVIFCSLLLYFVSRSYYKHISSSLKQSEELLSRYQALSMATKEGIVDLDLITDTAIVNRQMQLFMQEEKNEVEHFSIRQRKKIHPEDLARINKNLKDTLATEASTWQGDYRYLLPDGHYHDMISRGFIIRHANGKPLRMISAVQDVTEIRNVRTALFQQELKHRQSLGQSIIKTQEEERNRWALELHDNVCQVLTVVKLYLDELHNRPMNASSLLPKTKEMTEKALNDIRQLSASIKPPEFSITTLKQSIEQLLANILRVKRYEFQLKLGELHEEELNDDQKLMIFRVVQEQLNNIMKYGEASLINIHITTGGDNVAIMISDNGKGFDTSRIERGIGLRNIRSRLQMYAGNLVIDSAPGEGCRLNAGFSLA